MSPTTTKNKVNKPMLIAVLSMLSQRNQGVIATMSRKHMEAMQDKQLDGQDANKFIHELYEQIQSEGQKNNGTFEPEIVQMITRYVNR